MCKGELGTQGLSIPFHECLIPLINLRTRLHWKFVSNNIYMYVCIVENKSNNILCLINIDVIQKNIFNLDDIY